MGEKLLYVKPQDSWREHCRMCEKNIPNNQGCVDVQDRRGFLICFSCANSFQDAGVEGWRNLKEDPSPFWLIGPSNV